MQRSKWTERKFTFDMPEGWMNNVLERLRGTPVRIKEMVSGLSHEQLTFKQNDEWSIQEHVGHLIDLESLHDGRIDDFLARKEILRAADMSNKKTYEEGHNQKNINDILSEFIKVRNEFIKRLEELDDETQRFKSMHPRLKVMMRPVDMAFFTAEHDDHHLASMRLQLKHLGKQNRLKEV